MIYEFIYEELLFKLEESKRKKKDVKEGDFVRNYFKFTLKHIEMGVGLLQFKNNSQTQRYISPEKQILSQISDLIEIQSNTLMKLLNKNLEKNDIVPLIPKKRIKAKVKRLNSVHDPTSIKCIDKVRQTDTTETGTSTSFLSLSPSSSSNTSDDTE